MPDRSVWVREEERPLPVMLDPSVLDPIHDTGQLENVLNELNRGPFSLFVPRSYYQAAVERQLPLDTLARLYGWPQWQVREPGPRGSGRYPEGRRLRLEELAATLPQMLERLPVEPFVPDPRLLEEDADALMDFTTAIRDPFLRQITEEEWFFLGSQSLIASRLKRPFNAFIRAGGVSIEVGRRTVRRIELRTLKKHPDAELRAIDHLQALGKWIAAGGASLALLNPLIGVAAGVAANAFYLLDP